MTKEETIKIIKILELNYEKFSKQLENKENLQTAVNMWEEAFKNTKYNICLKAIKNIIVTNNERPTINEVKKEIIKIEKQQNDEFVWKKVYKVISNGIYMTETEFKNLDIEFKNFFKNLENLKKISKTRIKIVNTKIKDEYLKYYNKYYKNK